MLKLSSIAKRQVLATDLGKVIGRPVDILVDPSSHQISLVVMSEGEVPELSVVIPAAAIGKFDLDALTIQSMSDARIAVHDKWLLSRLQAGRELRRRPVFTKDGQRLGRIDGVEVDDAGAVTAYRVRKPRLGLLRPRQVLTPNDMGALSGEFAVASTPVDPEQSKPG